MPMHYVYMFSGGDPDFVWVSKRQFKKRFRLANAVGFLETIRNRIQTERGRRKTDYYCGLRQIFAELDGLGKLCRGEEGPGNTAANAVLYGGKYLALINQRYADLYGLLF